MKLVLIPLMCDWYPCAIRRLKICVMAQTWPLDGSATSNLSRSNHGPLQGLYTELHTRNRSSCPAPLPSTATVPLGMMLEPPQEPSTMHQYLTPLR